VEGEGGSVVDLSILFAILAYGLFALGVHVLVLWLDRRVARLRYDAELAEYRRRVGSGG
jgi:hypothetical protein